MEYGVYFAIIRISIAEERYVNCFMIYMLRFSNRLFHCEDCILMVYSRRVHTFEKGFQNCSKISYVDQRKSYSASFEKFEKEMVF